MSDTENTDVESQEMDLPEISGENEEKPALESGGNTRTATDLQAVFDVPVKVSAVLGRSRMEVSELLRLKEGTVVELDRKVGEPIDIFINNRLVARGEVVIVENRLGVTMTEIIKTE